MPTRHRSATGQVRRQARRKLVWCETNQVVTIAAAAFSNLNLLAQFSVAGASTLGITTMRTIVRIQVENWAAVGDDIQAGLLVGRLADVGVATNLAATPELDWAYHTELFPSASGAAISVAQVFDWDVRAKRKVQELDQVYLLCMANGSAASKTMQVFVRTLVALP